MFYKIEWQYQKSYLGVFVSSKSKTTISLLNKTKSAWGSGVSKKNIRYNQIYWEIGNDNQPECKSSENRLARLSTYKLSTFYVE